MSGEEKKPKSWWDDLRDGTVRAIESTRQEAERRAANAYDVAGRFLEEQAIAMQHRQLALWSSPPTVQVPPQTPTPVVINVPKVPPPTPDISSANVQVIQSDGTRKHFVEWFNDTLVKKSTLLMPGGESARDPWRHYLFGVPINKAAFVDVWDRLTDLCGKSPIGLNEFIARLMIMYNETGGSLKPVSEVGSLKYLFESIPGVKSSYNGGANRLAGDQLKMMKAITSDDDVALWNGTTWPTGQSEAVYKAAVECDFNKFRGRGLAALTFRRYYLTFADAFIRSATGKGVDDLSDRELTEAFTKPEVYVPSYRALHSAGGAGRALAKAIAGDFEAYGNAIAGGTTYGPRTFAPRCLAVRSALTATGYAAA